MRRRFLLVIVIAIGAACGPKVGGGDDDGDGGGCPGCVCQPGTGTCDGDVAHACRSDGSGFVDVYCDPVQGLSCGPGGTCAGACAPASLAESYIGCDYWPTVTGNIVSAYYDFAVAVSNTTGGPATVTIDGGALGAAMRFEVGAQSTVVQRLPWVPALKLAMGQTWSLNQMTHSDAGLAARGAYHLRSTAPVTVYQFNPLDFHQAGAPENSFSNDASLLFPTNAWRDDYYTTTFAAIGSGASAHPSELAVTASQDDTRVTITPRADTVADGGAPAFASGAAQTVTLGAGDVIELGSIDGDLTGSRVQSDRPVQVIGAHFCADVPPGASFCDHLEESMFPVDALSYRYIVVAPAVTTIPDGKEETIRIVATQADTTLSYDPPVANAPAMIANPGDFVEIARTAASFQISANHKVLVAQYMEGSSIAGNTGDPSMALAVPVEQYRADYLFHAPTNYTTNYVDIIAPGSAAVVLDGSTLVSFTPIGASGFGVARVTPLGNGPLGDGNHAITSTMPFGISVYGYGQDTSYWYPGGLDLKPVP